MRERVTMSVCRGKTVERLVVVVSCVSQRRDTPPKKLRETLGWLHRVNVVRTVAVTAIPEPRQDGNSYGNRAHRGDGKSYGS